MRKSLQNEIPKARINIQLDVETGSGVEKKELPMKLLVLGDFSRGKTKGRVVKRERIGVSKNNVDKVIADLNPEINIVVKNKLNNNNDDMQVKLDFSSLKDFNPQSVALKIPQLKKLIAMRNLLKELKSNVLDDLDLRRKLEAILSNQDNRKSLQEELTKIAPIDSMSELTGGDV